MKRLDLTITGWLVLIGLVVALPYLLTGPYDQRVFGMAALQAAFAVTFAMILRSGYVSMSHTAFGAMGAYLSAALVVSAKWNFWPALLVTLAVVGAIALGLGWLILRLKGPYFFLISFCFLEAVILFFRSVGTKVFGGPNGIVGVPRPSPIHLGITTVQFTSMQSFWYVSAGVFLLSLWVVWRILRSRYGMILMAARQSSLLASTVGIDVFRHKLMGFVVGSALAGLIGIVLGHFNGVVHINDFSVVPMVLVVVFAVVGGAEVVWGPVLGAFLLVLAGEQLRALHEVQLLGYGALLVLVMVAWPAGMAGALTHLYGWATRRTAQERGRHHASS